MTSILCRSPLRLLCSECIANADCSILSGVLQGVKLSSRLCISERVLLHPKSFYKTAEVDPLLMLNFDRQSCTR